MSILVAHKKSRGNTSKIMDSHWWKAMVFSAKLRHVNTPKIGVVIPTFLGGVSVGKAIESVRSAGHEAKMTVSIVLVDNHPESVDRIYSDLADHYISLPRNPGFGAACNSGISLLIQDMDFDFVFLLNPDAYVDNSFFKNLNEYLEKQTEKVTWPIMPLISYDYKMIRIDLEALFTESNELITIIDLDDDFLVFEQHGPSVISEDPIRKRVYSSDFLVLRHDRVLPEEIRFLRNGEQFLESLRISEAHLNEDQLVQNAGSYLSSPFSGADRNMGWLTSASVSTLGGQREAWCGAAVLLPRDYIISLKGFDETFFLYYEDAEFSLRGWKVGIFPQLVTQLRVTHQHSGITGRYPKLRQREIWKSQFIFSSRKNGVVPTFALFCYKVLRFTSILMRRKTTFRHFVKFHLPEITSNFLGFIESLRVRPANRYLRDK